MLGIPADEQRPRMDEALDVIMALLRGETVTKQTDWFTLQDARLQLKPYSEPNIEVAVAASISPTGAKAAGKHGTGLLSIAATTKQGFDAIGSHWKTWNEVAAQHGHVADRSKWRLVGPMHLADTREQARADVEYGIVPFSKYFTHVLPAGPTRGDTPAEIIANNDEDGFAVIGTPDDAIAKIESLVDESGGFGTFLLFGHDWATPGRDQAQLRAVRAVRDAALHRPARRAAGVVRLGHRQRRRVREPRGERDHEGDRRSRAGAGRELSDSRRVTR